MMTTARLLTALLGLTFLTACTDNGTTPGAAPPVSVDQGQVTALAKSVLRGLQAPSFRENREYCGVIGVTPAGELAVAEPSRGRAKLCITFNVPETWQIVAIYHTHGAYDPNAHSEVPSVQDIESVSANRIIGYVSTPGGRFWSFSGLDQTATLICGVGCLPKDPRHVADRPVKDAYTIEELRVRQATLR